MRGGRSAILKGAMDVIGRKGYAAASIREICREAGVTKPVLYYHFRGKDHLYRELMIECFSYYLHSMLSAAGTSGTWRERLERIVYEDLRSVKESPMRTRFLLRMIFSPEGNQPSFNYVKEMERQRRVIASALQEGIDAEAIQGRATDLATALIGMNLIAVLEHLFTGRATLTRRAARRHVGLLLEGARKGSCSYTDR